MASQLLAHVEMPAAPKQRSPEKWLLIGVICLFNGFLGYRLLAGSERPLWDLPQFYLASKVMLSGHTSQIYDQQAYRAFLGQFRAENPETAQVTWVYFNRPAFEAPLFAPLSLLSYHHAQILSWSLNFLLLAILVWMLPQWLPAVIPTRIWLFAFMPFLLSIGLGQDTLLLTLLVGFGLHLASEKKDAAAGLILALAGFKPHLIALVPLAFLAGRRWKLLASFAATASILGLISFGMVGMSGLQQWGQLLLAPTTDLYPERMGNLRALAINVGIPVAVFGAVIALISFGTILWRESFVKKCSAALLMALLASPHTFNQDYSLMAVAGLLAFPPAALFSLLIPWPYFVVPTNHNMIPMIFLNLACLVTLALERPALRWWQQFVTSWRERNALHERSVVSSRSGGL